MTTIVRVAAWAAAAGLVWSAAASRAAGATVLPASAVVPGATLVQPFGCTTLTLEPFDPYCPSRHFHSGVDLAAPAGSHVFAAAAGDAYTGFDENGCGLYVVVAVDAHVRMLYCHLSRTAMTAGAVTAGVLLGEVGSSGLATGPHLHLEVQLDGRPVDPVRWLGGS
jgi:murein DD-endopeptidase MepM/ murein hydrolase activator NlpD